MAVFDFVLFSAERLTGFKVRIFYEKCFSTVNYYRFPTPDRSANNFIGMDASLAVRLLKDRQNVTIHVSPAAGRSTF